MSKKKQAIRIELDKNELISKISRGCNLNQHAAVMKDRTKYNRKPKHRRDFREERHAGLVLYENTETRIYSH